MSAPRLAAWAAGLCWVHSSCQEQTRIYGHDAGAQTAVREEFSGSLAQRWRITGAGDPGIGPASIQSGRLVLKARANHPVWLKIPHPRDFALDLDLWPQSAEADAKIILAGDGQSFGPQLRDTAGYVLIFGAYNGSQHLIARRNEHGDDLVSRFATGVLGKRRYHFRIEARDGTIRWMVDGRHLLTYTDDRPLHGSNAQYLGLSGWRSTLVFDNLRLQAL